MWWRCEAVIRRHDTCGSVLLGSIISSKVQKGGKTMAWTTPVLIEICIGLEINGYLPADGYVPPEF
jgi:coenzyme PQQ precursor peptide PqqA